MKGGPSGRIFTTLSSIPIIRSLKMNNPENIVFFDGICTICNRFVDFCLRHDKKGVIYYASLQSDFARNFLATRSINVTDISTIYFYTDGKIFDRSTAVIKILKHFGGLYSLFAGFYNLLNKRSRDYLYNLIARNRYRLRGKKDSCRLPTALEQQKFLS